MECYGGISTSTSINSDGYTSLTQNESSSKASSTPLENQGNSEIMGLAVFKNDKLVGELSALETLCHLLITDKVESCNISIPNPSDKSKSIDLYVHSKSSPKVTVKNVNGTPFIKLNLNLEAKILSINSTSGNISENTLNDISSSANSYIESIMNKFLYKTAKEYESDINGFGIYALSSFATMNDFENYNWLENYKNSFFDVTVNTTVQSSFLLNRQ